MPPSVQFLTAACAAVILLSETAATGASGSNPAAPRPPQFLSQTGLYVQPGTSRIDSRNLHYSPQYPLWSDGARKSRWVFIPPGTRIDAHDTDAWDFPVGTKFWKEFDFNGHKVETRLIWKTSPEAWVFATYLWSADEKDATLAPAEGVPSYVEIVPGKRHNIPGVLDCRMCHDSGRTEILGFTALQLSTDRDPSAPHAEPLAPDMATLQTLEDKHLLRPSRADLLQNPPRIATDNPRTRSALGYLSANCGSCHNPQNPIASLGMMLLHSSLAATSGGEPALQTAVGVQSRWAIPGRAAGETQRLSPGAPERSAILYRMRSRSPISQMPPLGTTIADDEAVQLLTQWIRDDLGGATRATDPAPR